MKKTIAALTFLMLLAALTIGQDVAAQNTGQRIRKNIDALTQEEMANYLHALQIVTNRDPMSVGSYAYFAALHNDVEVGPCEHESETFLPWHRAHLHDFESELRAADPPRTANVTIPYWNWSEAPSGSRYPIAFENEVLLKRPDRKTTPICKAAANANCDRLAYPWSDLDADVLSVKSWSSPTEANFGSFSLNQAMECRERQDGGYGVLEQPPHNTMHFAYIGGLMANPGTAAEDPIFWSYHAFIDLLWWNWQQRRDHKVDSCLDCKLCGLNWTVRRVVSSEAQLNVTYDFVPPAAPPVALMAENALPAPLASVDLALGRKVDHIARRTSLVTIPSKPVKTARAVIQDVRISSPVTFQVNLFFYPQSEAGTFNPKDRAMRERGTIYVGTVWQKHHGPKIADRLTQTFQVDLAPYLNPLIARHKGETWVLDARTYADPTSGAGTHGVAADPAEIRSILQVGGVSVSFD